MVDNKNYSRNMTNGNVAYELQPEIEKKIKRKSARKPHKKSLSKIKIMGTILAIALFSFLTLGRYATINNMSADVRKSKEAIKQIQMENENVMVKIANLNNMKKIEQEALGKYGMIVPKNEDIVYVEVKGLTASQEQPKQTAFQMIQRMLGLIY